MQIQPLHFCSKKTNEKRNGRISERELSTYFNWLKTGGMKTIKMVKSKLEKASAAHAGQAKALGKVIDKKKLLVGGLLTKGIKSAYKAYRKTGRKTSEKYVTTSKRCR